jgi:hypothetical protein
LHGRAAILLRKIATSPLRNLRASRFAPVQLPLKGFSKYLVYHRRKRYYTGNPMSQKRLNEKPLMYIFHLCRGGTRPALLYSLKEGGEFISRLEGSSVRGCYGKEPRIESITLLRNDLYRLAETAVKQWVFELRFIPRFLISSGVFLVTYFFASVAIRDPIPVIDEILIAGAVSVIVYLLVGKRFLSSRAAEEKRAGLYIIIDDIAFTESAFAAKAEDLLALFDGYENAELLRIYHAACAADEPHGPQEAAAESGELLRLLPEWEDEAQALELCLKEIFQEKMVKDFGKRLAKKISPETEKNLTALRRLVCAVRIDFPLFVFYTVLRRALR